MRNNLDYGHGPAEVFDSSDLKMMELLANFAAMAVRQERQQKVETEHVKALAAAEMANDLAHQINSSLQSRMSALYLAAEHPGDTKEYLQIAAGQVQKLSSLVKKILQLYDVR